MKKLLTFLMMSILAIGVGWAGTYSLTPDESSTGTSSTSYITTLTGFTYNDVGWKMNQWNPSTLQVKTNQTSPASEFRFYNTTAFPGKITKVVIKFSALTLTNTSTTGFMFVGGDSEITGTTGGTNGVWNSADKTITWTPSASDNFTFFAFYQNGKVATGTNKLATANAIVVTYDDGSVTIDKVATPTFSVPAGHYTSAKNVTINCETEDADIYWGTDGVNFASYDDDEPILVNETMTLYAYAMKSGMDDSDVASAKYYIEDPAQPGDEIIFDYQIDKEFAQENSTPIVQSFKNGVTIDFAKGTGSTAPTWYENANGDVRLYAGNTLTVNAGELVIERVSFTYDENNPILNPDVEPGLFDNAVWTVGATSGVLTSTNKPRIATITVKLAGGITVESPTISGTTPFVGSTEVTITVPEGTTVYYTTDNSTPSNESNEYNGPFEITETTTVKAIAYDANNNASSVASKEFVKASSASTVAEILALTDGTTFTFTGRLVVSGQQGSYLYAQDATGGILLYGTAPAYEKGDVIPANFSAKYVEDFKGAPELKEMTNMAEATETAQLTAEAISPDQVTVANAFKYAVIQGATIENNTIVVGDEAVDIYNRFNVTVPTDGKTYDVYGITGWYDGAQFMPLVFEAEAEPEYYLVGSHNTYIDDNNETQWVLQDENYKFTLNDEGKYVLDGVTCPDNVQFKILKVKGSQITWCGGSTEDNVYGIHGGWYKDIPLTIDGGNNYKIESGGTFNFTMTIGDNNSFTVIKAPVVIKGSFNGWSASGVEMDNNEGNTGWTTTMELADNTQFGFNDGWGNWHGGNDEGIDADDFENHTLSRTMTSNGNFIMLNAGKYIITVNRDLTTLIVSEYVVTHSIEIDKDIENGTIVIEGNKDIAAVGETVTIVATPDPGYVLDKVTVTAGDDPVEVNNMQFVMPDADVFVSAAFKEPEAEDGDYVKVTSDEVLTNGTYLIVYEDGSLAFNGGLETLDGTGNSISVVINNDFIEGGESIDAASFTIDVSAGTIKSASGYYIGQTTDANGLKYSQTTVYTNTISIDESGDADIKSQGNAYLRYNSASGDTRFRYYKSSTYTAQKPIALYKKLGEVVPTLPTPEITGETPFLESTTVTITCADGEAVIRYSTDGEEPTAESTPYEGPFTLTEAATVKAIAFKGQEFSNVASKDFEKKLSVATIAEYKALDEDKTFVFTGNVTVTYVNGRNLYVKDDTGAALIYGNSNFDFAQGQVLDANWTATTTIYNGLLEAQNPSDLEATETTVVVTPVEKNVNDISTANDNEYIIVKNVHITAVVDKNFTITDAENNTIAGRTSFTGVEHPDDFDVTYNITCIVGEYNGTVQLYPTEYKATSASLEGVEFTENREWATWFGNDDLALPENVTAYVVTGFSTNNNGTAVEVEEIGYIPSGVAVLLHSTTTASNLTAEIYTGTLSDDIEGGPLKGDDVEQTVEDAAYVLYNNQFVLLQEGTTVGAHRCYLPASALVDDGEQSGAPVLRIAMPGTVTGIDDLRYDSNGKAVGYYDLTGRYIGTSLNGKRGIFITSDGKKVVK